MPTIWDDTKVIHSRVGKLGTIARRHGYDWFVGTINGNSEKEVSIPLDFLDPNKDFVADVYFDDPHVKTVTKVGIEHIEVDNTSVIKRKIDRNNGLAIHIYPKTK